MTHNLTQTNRHIEALPEDRGLRLDAFLTKKLSSISRSQANKLIKEGHVTISGLTLKPSHQIVGNEIFLVKEPERTQGIIVAEEIPLHILFSDDHIAVVNKPKGLVTHPGAGVKSKTLCHALLYHFPNMNIGNVERPGIVHRLDKDTSGIMVIAKSEQAHRVLSDAFKQREVEKTYRAFCVGGIMASSFSLKTGHMRNPHNRLKFFTGTEPPKTQNKHVRFAHTEFLVLARQFGISELKATLHTGRTHQIRAQLADIGHPLIGDELYGGKRIFSTSLPDALLQILHNIKGQALHAESIAFLHPITKERLSFTAPLQESLSILSDLLRSE